MRTVATAVGALLFAGRASGFTPLSPSTAISTRQAKTYLHPNAPQPPRMQAGDDSGNPFSSILGGIFGGAADKEPDLAPTIPDFVVSPSYSLAIGFAVYGAFFVVAFQASTVGVILGGLNLLFASFLALQTTRLRFVFDGTSFELKSEDPTGVADSLGDTGENIVVGGANRWDYSTFVNWDFFPSRSFPILVYFKENQTPADKWNEGPGQLDEVGGGQIHFFPAIADCRQLEEQFELRGCAKVVD